MGKKLIVCADGTWNNEDGAGSQTNVAKLHRVLQNSFVEEVSQLVCYVTGVGTRFGERVRGGAFGYGLDANIKEAYRFLVDHYEEGDQLFFFGFSRGAYTARSLAGFIRNSGLLKREHFDRLDEAFELYRKRSPDTKPDSGAALQFKQQYSRTPDIEFVGVWDTVGSLGVPLPSLKMLSWFARFADRDFQFHDTSLSKIIKHAYHAISIHEHRGTFPASKWQKQPGMENQVLEQVWFPGVHCDVGGGYPASGLADASFLWMVDKAKACGLLFREAGLAVGATLAPDPLGKLHDSYAFPFNVIDWFNFRFGGSPRTFDVDPSFCESVSNIARDRFQLKTGEKWPATFLPELQRATTQEEARVQEIHP